MVEVKDVSFIRTGFYGTGIHTIQEILARYSERTGKGEPDELASRIARFRGDWRGFTSLRLSVTEWELISEAFLECGNDHWEATIASEINEMLRNHGWCE